MKAGPWRSLSAHVTQRLVEGIAASRAAGTSVPQLTHDVALARTPTPPHSEHRQMPPGFGARFTTASRPQVVHTTVWR